MRRYKLGLRIADGVAEAPRLEDDRDGPLVTYEDAERDKAEAVADAEIKILCEARNERAKLLRGLGGMRSERDDLWKTLEEIRDWGGHLTGEDARAMGQMARSAIDAIGEGDIPEPEQPADKDAPYGRCIRCGGAYEEAGPCSRRQEGCRGSRDEAPVPAPEDHRDRGMLQGECLSCGNHWDYRDGDDQGACPECGKTGDGALDSLNWAWLESSQSYDPEIIKALCELNNRVKMLATGKADKAHVHFNPRLERGVC